MSTIEELEGRALMYRFFSNVFLVLPDDAFTRQMLAWPADDDTEGGRLIAAWAKENAGADMPQLVQAVSVDRTRLFRGLTAEGPVPPYESMFVGNPTDHTPVMAGVAAFYDAAGFKQIDGVHDAPDYLGNEMAFMDSVLSAELAAVQANDAAQAGACRALEERFVKEHLSRWIERYTAEMQAKATTDLYRGLALLLRDFMRDEVALAAARE